MEPHHFDAAGTEATINKKNNVALACSVHLALASSFLYHERVL
jgi:hypothetical protein